MKAGRISSIFQYLLTAARNSSSSTSFGLTSSSAGKAPLANQHVIAGARGRRAVHRAQIAVAAVHRQRMKQGAVDHRGKAAGGAGWISRELRDVGLHEAGRGQTALLSGLGGSRDGGGREVDADHGVAVGGKGQ